MGRGRSGGRSSGRSSGGSRRSGGGSRRSSGIGSSGSSFRSYDDDAPQLTPSQCYLVFSFATGFLGTVLVLFALLELSQPKQHFGDVIVIFILGCMFAAVTLGFCLYSFHLKRQSKLPKQAHVSIEQPLHSSDSVHLVPFQGVLSVLPHQVLESPEF
ncbi:hypothetical protein RCL1_005521 [Eukaryota sp. TZLM3-RCL]